METAVRMHDRKPRKIQKPKGEYKESLRDALKSWMRKNKEIWRNEVTWEEALKLSNDEMRRQNQIEREIAEATFRRIARKLKIEFKRKERSDKYTRRRRKESATQLLLFTSFPPAPVPVTSADLELYEVLSRDSLGVSGVLTFLDAFLKELESRLGLKPGEIGRTTMWRLALEAASNRVPLKTIRNSLFTPLPGETTENPLSE